MPALLGLDPRPVRLCGRGHDRRLDAERRAAAARDLATIEPARQPRGPEQAERDVAVAHPEPPLVPERVDAGGRVPTPPPAQLLVELARDAIQDAVEVGPHLERGEANVVTGVRHQHGVARADGLHQARGEPGPAEPSAQAADARWVTRAFSSERRLLPVVAPYLLEGLDDLALGRAGAGRVEQDRHQILATRGRRFEPGERPFERGAVAIGFRRAQPIDLLALERRIDP